MKKRNVLTGISGLVLVFGLVLIGCPESVDYNPVPKPSDAELTEVTVAGASARLGTPGPYWDSDELFPGSVILANAGTLTDAAVVATPLKPDAFIYYARAADLNAPVFVEDPTFTFTDGDYLYLEVFSPNKDAVRFYKIRVLLPSNAAGLDLLSIGGALATRGTPATAWDDAALEAGIVNLTTVQATDAVIVPVLTNGGEKFRYARVSGSGAPVFADSSTLTFAQGDFLYIELTSSDGTKTLIYKIQTNVGNIGTVSSVKIGDIELSLPDNPAPSLTAISDVVVQLFNEEQPTAGWPVTSKVTQNSDAIVTYAVAQGADTPVFGPASALPLFQDRDYFYVQAVSSNGTVTSYYKWQIFLLKTATIQWGSPTITANATPTTTGSLVVDSLWNTVEWLDVTRILPIDSRPGFTDDVDAFGISPHVSAKAKLMWDLTGVYLYIEVKDDVVNTSNPGGTTGSAAWWDGVELGINENIGLTVGNYDTNGGFYGKNYGGGTNSVYGWDSRLTDSSRAFAALNKNSSGRTADGWAVTMQVPWRFNTLIREWGPVYNSKVIGAEISVHDSVGTGGNTTVGNANGRRGVIAWNNIFAAAALVTNSARVTLAGAPTDVVYDVAIDEFAVSLGAPNSLGTPANTAAGATAGRLSINAAAANLPVRAATLDPNLTSVRFAKTTTSGATPTFGVNNTLNFSNGDFLWLEVSSPGNATKYYKLEIAIQSSATAISGITVAGKEQTILGTPGNTYVEAELGQIHLTSAQITTGRQLVVTASQQVAGIRVGINTTDNAATNAPTTWTPLTNSGGNVWTANTAAAVTNNGIIAIEVTAENNTTRRYYRFTVATQNLAVLTAVTVGGMSASSLGTAAGAWNSPNLVNGALSLTPAQATNALIVPTGTFDTVAYAIAPNTTTEPVFGTTATLTFTAGDYLYIKTESTDDATYRNIYRLAVNVGSDDTTITGVTVTQSGTTYIASSVGTPGTAANIQPTTNRGAITVGALSGTSTIAVQGLAAGATADWAVANATTGAPGSYATGTVTFSATNTNLVIRVTAQNGIIRYYRIVASL